MSENKRAVGGNARLSDTTIDRLFAAIGLNYGRGWASKWASGTSRNGVSDDGIDAAKAYWARELGGYIGNLGCIKAALKRLPPHPPSLPEFKELCRTAKPPRAFEPVALLDKPKLSAEMAEERKQKMAEMLRRCYEKDWGK